MGRTKILIILLAFSLLGLPIKGLEAEEKKCGCQKTQNANQVSADLFVMSQCPWGVRAENIFNLLQKKFGKVLEVNLYYIVQKDEKTKEFRSLHGKREVEENMRQLLIAHYYPNRLWNYLQSRNTDTRNPEWKHHAQYVGIDFQLIEEKMASGEGKELLGKNIKEQIEGKRWKQEGEEWSPPQASPTIYLNGMHYQGSLALPSLTAVINNCIVNPAFKIQNIPECYSDSDCIQEKKVGHCLNPGTEDARCEFREPERIRLKALVSRVAPEPKKKSGLMVQLLEEGKLAADLGSDVTSFLNSLERVLPELEVERIDYQSKAGKRLIKELDIDFLPAYIFDKSLESTAMFNRLVTSSSIIKKKNYYILISPQAREGIYLNRPAKSKTLEIFIMSHCPFGPEVVNQLVAVQREGKIDKKIKIAIHYIASLVKGPKSGVQKSDQLTFQSLHGIAEVEEDMRQLCIKKYYPDKFFGYLLLRNRNIKSTLWERPAIESMIDPALIRVCLYREGDELLNDNIQRANELKISASPTYLWENKYLILNSEKLKRIPELERIDIKISGRCQ